jgi:HEAT repeat protein
MPGLEMLLSLGLPLLAGSIGFSTAVARRRQFLAQWQNLLAKHGLVPLEASSFWIPRLRATAQAGVMEVRVEQVRKRGLFLQVRVPGLLADSGLRLRRQALIQWPGREIDIGDGRFDQTFLVEGETGKVAALLDAKTRHLLLQVNETVEPEIRHGVLRVKVTDRTLPGLLSLLLELGQRFTQAPEIARRLTDNAREDSKPGVRLRNLLLLSREHQGSALTAETLRAACRDESPEIRLRAALELGADGYETLVALAEGEDGDTWRAQAVAALGRQLPWERTQALLHQALRRHHTETARACVGVLGQCQAAGVAGLVEVLEGEQDEIAAAAAVALGETGEETAEPPLIRALRHGSPDVRLAAAKALGRVGSVAAVLPLQEAAEEDRDLRRTVGQAIAEIQSRLQGAAPGQLSLAQTEAGQLSLAGDEAGQLSLAPHPAGELPLPPERQRA